MFKNLLLTIGLVLATSLLVFSQTGTLKGTLTDSETKSPIPFANIIIEVAGAQKGGGSSDFDGNYTIKPITPGTYTVKATYVGYQTKQINGVIISADNITFLDVKLNSTTTKLDVVEISTYAIPLIDKGRTTTGSTATAAEIAKLPNKSANAIATTVGGVYAKDGGGDLNIRGGRSSGTVMYIDGIRVTGSSSLPESAIDQVSVILGGIPAQYGDATGGIISVTTKGPSRKFAAGVELQSSQYLDAFGYNRASLNLNGPLLKSKDSDVALLGYFLAGEFTYKADNYPNAIGSYKLNDTDLADLEQNPLTVLDNGGITYASNYIRESQLEHMPSAINNNSYQGNFSGKIDVKTSPTINLSFGGSYSRSVTHPFSYGNSLFNYNSFSERTENTYRLFGRFSHRFETPKESESLIKNVFYSIQADYSHYDYLSLNPEHGEDFFAYGNLGKYETYKDRNYTTEAEYNDTTHMSTYYMDAWADTAYLFTASGLNPLKSNYTDNYYRIAAEQGYIPNSRDDVILGLGLLNSSSPNSVYNLWNSPGSATGSYTYSSTDQIGFNVKASADIGNHALVFGFIYEQRISRGYTYGASGLWTLMRGITNSHINELDLLNGHNVALNDTTTYVNYDRLYDGASQYTFDKILRSKLGLDIAGTEWVDIDSYDMNDHTIAYYDDNGDRHIATLDQALSVDMFTPDELLTIGSGYANAYGYDYYGNKLDYKPTIDDFINGKSKWDINGTDVDIFSRHQDAIRPVYMAGYIQDQFTFKDLIFNIGVRVDHFDANQPVLKDPYLLYDAKSVNEATDFSHPSNVGSDYVVYVDNMNDPTKIMGYRSGDVWYNSEGLEITGDPADYLDAGNGVNPYLIDPDNQDLDANAFEDYKPQINFMPRIAFSFPISDDALFFAHYDVLTQRPTNNSTFNPLSYYFWPVRGVGTINNPNLKPEQTIDYEIGFQQKLNATSSLTIATFYREVRDQIQAYRYTEAYPQTYYGYNNIDFGTVKGLTFTYDLRRTKNVRLKASYTLQFAKGTGSDANTQANIIRAGLPNLRTLLPLNHDQRHAFNVNMDYRYGSGKQYNGPTTERTKADGSTSTINWLESMGLNVTFWGGSGTPYTKSKRVGVFVIDGSINGARLPSTYRFDARLDRDFDLSSGKGGDKKSTYLNVYLTVLNVLNTKNIMSVYAATGTTGDDGFLAADEWQSTINSQVSPIAYRELYRISKESPGQLSQPRQIRIGMSLNF